VSWYKKALQSVLEAALAGAGAKLADVILQRTRPGLTEAQKLDAEIQIRKALADIDSVIDRMRELAGDPPKVRRE
jgi:hypothetical protein